MAISAAAIKSLELHIHQFSARKYTREFLIPFISVHKNKLKYKYRKNILNMQFNGPI